MKKIFIILYSVLFVGLCLTATATVQPKEYKGKIVVSPVQLEQVGDSLCVKFDFEATGVGVKSRRSITFTPVLIGQNTTMTLSKILIRGRIDYLMSERKVALMNKSERSLYDEDLPYATIKGYKNPQEQIKFNKTVVFESWMKDARLDMQEYVGGCGKSALVGSQLVDIVKLEPIVLPYQVTPFLAYVQPEVESVKRREMVGEAFLDFVVSKIDIRPDYMNNPVELKKITDMVNEVSVDSSVIVKSISVVGYASPEGSLMFNKQLSEGRANALVGYLLPKFDYSKSLYRIEFGGENWGGLLALVSNSNMAQREEVLAILKDRSMDDDVRKIKLQKLGESEPYRYMLREYYPRLRKAICRIDYYVKGFDVMQAKEVFKTRPQNLSLNEMYLVANTYDVGSKEFENLFETAVRLFPDDVIANLNAASVALARKDLEAAEQYLEKIEGRTLMAQYHNTRGVLLMLKGDYEEAKQQFAIAEDAGLESAKLNIEELKKKLENIEQLNKQANRNNKSL